MFALSVEISTAQIEVVDERSHCARGIRRRARPRAYRIGPDRKAKMFGGRSWCVLPFHIHIHPIRQPDIAKPTMHNKPVLMICPSTRSGQTKEAIASHLDR